MRDRFTEKARRIVELARNAAHRAGVAEFGPDYVLLGIAHYGEVCVASVVLKRCGICLDTFVESYGSRQPDVRDADSQISSAFVDAACNEARELDHNHVGSEHLLLAIVRSDSLAGKYLRGAGVDHQRIREATIEVLGVPARGDGR